jgi:hypothetical protein
MPSAYWQDNGCYDRGQFGDNSEQSQLRTVCKALVMIAAKMDDDLSAMGKGRNLSSVPGFEGTNILNTAQAIINNAQGGKQ